MGERATKFTPGPWRIATKGNFGNTIEADSGKRSYEFDNGYRTVAMFQACTASRRWDEEQDNALANGHLIAAAPDMFEALKRACEMLEALGDLPTMRRDMERAIAKAEGLGQRADANTKSESPTSPLHGESGE